MGLKTGSIITRVSLSLDEISQLQKQLLKWYRQHRRDLPWRRRPGDGYAQLVAEFMLQQTQVATVISYYNRFLNRFPTIEALAAADQNEVMALWSGLGYYSRARNLHAAARRIVEVHGGHVPRDVEALQALPGIGRYTAGAIASIAYNVRAAVLDGNVVRVLMRLLAITADPKSPTVREQLWRTADELLPTSRCGDFNQALMELGATLCSPRSPECPRCPLQSCCRAHHEGLVDHIPPTAQRTKVLPAAFVVAAIRHGERLLFAQRPPNGLWAGLWELPSEPIAAAESPQAALTRLKKRLFRNRRVATSEVGHITRQLTHRRITFHVYKGMLNGSASILPLQDSSRRWVGCSELGELGISRACEAVLKLIGWPNLS